MQSGAIISKLAGGKALPAELLGQILAETDGGPLFVEELTKAVVETMREPGTGNGEQEGKFVGAQHAAPVPALGIPATLQDALMTRLDRLGVAKEISQIGASSATRSLAAVAIKDHRAEVWTSLHPALGLAKSLGRREALLPIYGWFTEGFDTKDLQEAKTLLTELS